MVLARYIPSKRDHPVKAAAVLTAVIFVPAAAVAFLTFQKSYAFIATIAAAFLICLFLMMLVAVTAQNRMDAAEEVDLTASARSLAEMSAGEPWARRLAIAAVVCLLAGFVLEVVVTCLSLFARRPISPLSVIAWAVVSAVGVNLVCLRRERRLAASLREWSSRSPRPPLIVRVRSGSQYELGELSAATGHITVKTQSTTLAFPNASVAVEPDSRARRGGQLVTLTDAGTELRITLVGPRDPAAWPHLARQPKEERPILSPMWELVWILDPGTRPASGQ
jgi:DNA-binding LytR/AlgR family response regulator